MELGLSSGKAAVARLLRTGSGTLLLSNFALTGVGLITGVATARLLGPEGRGDLAIITYWPSFVFSLIDLALLETMTLRTAESGERGGAHRIEGAVLAAVCSVVGCVLGYFVLPFVLQTSQLHMLADTRAYLAYVPIGLFMFVPQGCLLGRRRYADVAMPRIGSAMIYVAALVALALLHRASPSAIAWASAGSMALQIPAGFAVLQRVPFTTPHPAPDILGSARLGALLQGVRIANVASQNEDRVLVTLTMSQRNIGIYQVPAMVSAMMPIIPTAMSQLVQSTLPSAIEGERPIIVMAAYTRAILLTVLASIAGIPCVVFLVPVLYGQPYAPAVLPTILILPGAVFQSGALVLQAASKALRLVRRCVVAELVSMIAMAAVALPLVPSLGINGVAVAFSVGRAVSWGMMLVSSRAALDVPARDLLPWSRIFLRTMVHHFVQLRDIVKPPAQSAVDGS